MSKKRVGWAIPAMALMGRPRQLVSALVCPWPLTACEASVRRAPASTVAKQAAAVQARQVAKAVIGAPSPGSTPGTTPVNPNASLRETIAAAVNAQRGLV